MFIKLGSQTFNSAHVSRLWAAHEMVMLETVQGGVPHGVKPLGGQSVDTLLAQIERMIGAQSPAEYEQSARVLSPGQLMLEPRPLIDEDKLIGEFKVAMETLAAAVKSIGLTVEKEPELESKPAKKSQR